MGAQKNQSPEKSSQFPLKLLLELHLALPNHQRLPSLCSDGRKILFVSGLIAPELRPPVVRIRLRLVRYLAAPVRMPETAVDKYHFPPRYKHQIRLSWKILPVQPETESHPVNHAAYRQLGKHSLTADTAHVLTAVHGSKAPL